MTDSTSQNKSSVMAKLLASYKSPFTSLQRGEQVQGKVTKVTRNEILVDVNAKSEALVIEKDRRIHNVLMAILKVGDSVTATVINPESEAGIPLVSLRRFVEDKAWDHLASLQKDHKTLEVMVTDVTKGGYVVSTDEGLSGFLPNSHMAMGGNTLTPGARLMVSVLELQRTDNKLIFTQKTTLSREDFDKLASKYPNGHKLSATIASIAPFGIFVALPVTREKGESITLDGLIHISEVAWDKTTDISEKHAVGDTVEAVVIGRDNDARRIDLSIKRLTSDPFTEIAKQYPVDRKLQAPVTRHVSGTVHVDLGDGVEGIIPKEKVPPNTSYEVGQTVSVTVSEVDTKRHKIYLSPVLLEKPLGYR